MCDNEALAIYIHFPYCKSRCPYCDFFRALKPRDFNEDELISRYYKDIDYFFNLLGKKSVKSVFFGGGTPSLLKPQSVDNVLDAISRRFDILPNAEISLEANPNTFEREKFLDFRKAGINRLSLGVQALCDNDLKFLGRTHSVDDALKAMELGVTNFPKFSIDLIYARPGQTWEQWQQEINKALSFKLNHISLYQLTIEDGTVFSRKGVKPLDDENAATLYIQTVSYLREQGFERYEVSNFARGTNNQSVHNMVYWQGGDYIGIGDGAHGRIHHQGKNYATVDGVMAEEISPYERAEELLLMGLRLKEGIDAERFYRYSGIKLFDFVDNMSKKELANLNLLCYDARNIRLTDNGFLLLDKVILDLVG